MKTSITRGFRLGLLFGVVLLFGDAASAQEVATEVDADRVPRMRTGGNVIIRNATILTAANGRIESGDIQVKDGKIVAVAPAGEIPKVDPEAEDAPPVIDATGKYIIPGIIDCHSHMAISNGINEGTLAITAECRIEDTVRNDDLTIYRALAGGVTTANILHGSANPIGGMNAVIRLKYQYPVEEMLFPDAPKGVKFALGENPKRSRGRFPNTRMGVEAVIRRGFNEARKYQEEWAQYRQQKATGATIFPPRRDLRLETLVGVMEGSVLVHAHCYRADEILMLIRIAEEFGFTVGTFQHVLEGFKVAPEIAAHGAGASTFSDWWAYKIEAYDAIPYNAALMTQAGVLSTFNSDSDEMVRRMYHEAAKGVKYGGMDEEAALQLVTLNAAKQLRIDDRVGSIEVGKDADLAIFSEHPFSVYARCEMTLIEGEVFFERPDARLYEDVLQEALPGIHPASADGSLGSADPGVEKLNATDTQTAGTVSGMPEAKTPTDPAPGRALPVSEAGPVTALVGGTIHPVSRPSIRDGVLLIQAGKIAAMGSREAVKIPAKARMVDITGRHVYPGMIDGGTSIGLTEIGSIDATLDERESGGFNPDLRSWIAINHDSEIIPVTRVNGITSVLSTPSGGSIGGQASIIRLDGWTREEMLVQAPLGLSVSFPLVAPDKKWQDDGRVKSLIKSFQRGLRYGERVDEARADGAAPPPRDLALEALVPYARGERPILVSANRVKHMVDAIEFAESNGLKVILRGCREGWKIASYLEEKDARCVVGPVHASPYSKYDPYDCVFTNAKALADAGVTFCFQTDDASNSRNLPYHAGMAAAYGLDRRAALRAVTLSAAEIFGVADRIGSLEPGKDADLLVTTGDPLEFLTEIEHLFIAGREVPLESKHTRLYERYLERLGQSPPPARKMQF